MPLTPEQRQYVVRSVVRILKDVNREEIIAALKEDVLAAYEDESVESEQSDKDLELDMVVLAVAEACRERLKTKRRDRVASVAADEDPEDEPA